MNSWALRTHAAHVRADSQGESEGRDLEMRMSERREKMIQSVEVATVNS